MNFKNVKKRAKKSGGFTLIELLLVIMLIAIIAVMSVPDYRQYHAREQMSAAVAETTHFFSEAFAQSRAKSQHQELKILTDQWLEFCGVLLDGTVTSDCQKLELPNGITMTIDPDNIDGWMYRAPYGDIDGFAGTVDITLSYGDDFTKELRVHALSGLVETL